MKNPNNWEVAVVDLFLREGSGAGVLDYCRNRRERQKLLVLTSLSTPELLKKCKSWGGDRLFDKSNQLDDLLAYCSELSSPAKLALSA